MMKVDGNMEVKVYGEWCVYVLVSTAAEKAILEMNRKEKNIVRGFLGAVKYASQMESRIRVMLIGDTGSGKWYG